MDILPGFQVGMQLVQRAQAMKDQQLNMTAKLMEMQHEDQLFDVKKKALELQNQHLTSMTDLQSLQLSAAKKEQLDEADDAKVWLDTQQKMGQDPLGVLHNPMPAFKTLKARQAYLDLQKSARETIKGISEKEKAIEEAKALFPKPGTATAFDKEMAQLENEQARLSTLTSNFEGMADTDPRKPGIKSEIDRTKQRVEMLNAHLKGPSTNLSVTSPTGESFQFSTGSGGGTSITGNDIKAGLSSRGLGTKIQPKIAQYENAVELANQLDKSLQVGDLGILGVIKEYKGKILGDIAPGMVNAKTMENRNKVIALRESIARDIPEGGRETEKQRQAVLQMLPSSGIIASVADAKIALKSVKELMQMRARNYAAEIGRVPLVSMSAEQIQQDYISDRDVIAQKMKKGLITRDEANALLEKSNKEHNDALSRFY